MTGNTALNIGTAKTLKRSKTPKISFGAIFVPIAPTNIKKRVVEANIAKDKCFLFLYPPIIINTREIIDSKTTKTVITLYMHNILKSTSIATIRKWKHSISDI